MKKIYALFTLFLVAFAATAQVLTFDPTVTKGSISDYTQAGEDKMTLECVTVVSGKGTLGEGKFYKFYKGGTHNISTTSGDIVKVEFFCIAAGDAKYGPANIVPKEGNYPTPTDKVGVWTGKTKKLVFSTDNNQVRCNKIVVTLEGADVQPPAPVTYTDKTIAELLAGGQDLSHVNLKLKDAKVVYVGENKTGKNYFLREGDKAIMLYGSEKLALQPNDVVSGDVKMDFKVYFGIPEMVDNEDTNADHLQVTPSTTAAQPREVSLDELIGLQHLCDLVIVRGVTITKEVSENNGKTYTNFYMNKAGKKVQLFKYNTDYSEYVNDKSYDVTAVFNRIFKGNAEVEPVTIAEAGAPVVAIPTITPAAGTYKAEVTVTIDAAAGATIYYTTDGTEPTVNSTRYTAPFTLTETATVKAIAVTEAGQISAVAVAAYTIEKELSKNQALFDFALNPWNLPVDADGKSTEGYLGEGQVITQNGVNLTANGKVRMYLNFTDKKSQLRVYTPGSITLTAPEGRKIVKVEFLFGQKNAVENMEGYADGVWTGSAAEVKFNATVLDKKNNQMHISSILVTLDQTTGIESVETTGHKAVIYDLQGRRVKAATQGLYIINGKKVYVK